MFHHTARVAVEGGVIERRGDLAQTLLQAGAAVLEETHAHAGGKKTSQGHAHREGAGVIHGGRVGETLGEFAATELGDAIRLATTTAQGDSPTARPHGGTLAREGTGGDGTGLRHRGSDGLNQSLAFKAIQGGINRPE